MALKMTWQPSLLPQKRKNGPPLGLKNLGNTCYLNSVLQCLTYTPPLANFCLKNQHSSSCDSATEADRKRDCPFCIIEKQIVRSLSIDSPLDTPSKISSCLRIFAEHFRFGRQEDAHEFLRYVIDACHNTCLRLKKLQQQRRKGGISNGGEGFNGSTAVKEIFGGALQSQVKCLSCGTESNKVDEIMDISLDVLHSSSLKESLQKFFQPEVLDGNNKYKCENCKKLVVARKQMSILQAPNVLVIQLKRFEGIFGGKVDKAIAFGEVLVLSSYMCKGSQDSHPEYNLFGTIVHSGFSPDSGHYYSYIKDAMGRWYCCNDSYVSLSTLQEVLSEKVYILFFSRTKQRPVPATTALSSNGVKSQGSNGSHTSKIPKTVSPIKALHTKPSVDCSSEKEKSTKPMVDKTPSSSQMKLSSLGNSGTTKLPAVSVNMKFFVNKRQPIERNGNAKASVCMEKSEKDMSSVISSNGSGKSKAVDGENSQGLTLANGDGKKDVASLVSSNGSGKIKPVNGENSQEFPLANGNGKKDVGSLASSNGSGKSKPVDGENSQEIPLENGNGKKDVPSLISSNGSGKSKTVVAENSQGFPLENGNGKSHIRPEMHENNDTSNRVMFGRGANYHESQNGGVHYPTDISGSKRKRYYEDSCILFAKDDHLRAKLEDLKEGLGKEAALVLRSCGWSDEVDRFMRSRKKLCAREVGNTASNGDELRKLLITQAKQTFISQIPESLKENLIERLRSASQEKQLLGP